MNRIVKIDKSTVLALTILAAVLIVTVLVYLPGLPGPLFLDDLPQLNGLIGQSATDPATLFGNHIVSTSGPLGRPVAMATFIADAVTHGPDTWWWKYNNLMFHLINGLLVFWLVALLLKASPRQNDYDHWIVGAVVAGWWLLHPLQASTVLYTVQRMTELSTLFVLAALVCYAKGRLLQDRSPRLGWLLIGLGFVLFYPLGVFSKESALIYPVYCSLIELIIFRFRGQPSLQRQTKVFHAVLLIGYASVAVLILANFSSVVLEGYAARDFTLTERVLTQFRVIVMYLSQILLPIQRNMGFFHDDVSFSTGLLDPITTLLSALVLIALVASGFLLRRKLPLYAFGILFFFASHAIESSFLGLELMFEHRNYIGSLGILIAAMSIALLAKDHRRDLAIVAAVVLIGFAMLTWQRSLTWSAPGRMYVYMYNVHPESPRLNLEFANAYTSAEDFPNARRLLVKAGTGLGPELHSLFLDCLETGIVDEKAMSRIALLQSGIVDGHTSSSADVLVGEVLSGRCVASQQSLVNVLDYVLASRARSDADVKSILLTKARLLESLHDIDGMMAAYLAAQELSQHDALPLYSAVGALVRLGQADAARDMLTQAFDLERNTRIKRREMAQKAFSELGGLYERGGKFEEALTIYADAAASMPKRSLAYLKAAVLLLQMKRYDEVRAMIEDIHRQNPIDFDEYEFSLRSIAAAVEQRR
jgi:tetratricopeptide (TPR) repeat protein